MCRCAHLERIQPVLSWRIMGHDPGSGRHLQTMCGSRRGDGLWSIISGYADLDPSRRMALLAKAARQDPSCMYRTGERLTSHEDGLLAAPAGACLSESGCLAMSLQVSEEIVASAALVFTATVTELETATDAEAPLVVRVDDVYRAPEDLELLAGQRITVELSGRRIPVGSEGVFFTNPWHFGETLTVRGIAFGESDVDLDALREQLRDVDERARERGLVERLAVVDLVVAGRVLNTQPAEIPPSFASEHSPQWWEATIQVEGVEKGELPEDRVVVLFPNSMDVRWYRAPKFQVGQSGVWLLTRGPAEGLPSEVYTALDPLDAHPLDARERLRRLLG